MSVRRPKVTLPLVLVVDDYEDNREMYAEGLRVAGYLVECAEDGNEAVAKARALKPAVIMMDLSLPVMDGWEATRILKSDPETQGIHIIAISGHGERQYIDRAQAAGIDHYLMKPITPAEVVTTVGTCLARRLFAPT